MTDIERVPSTPSTPEPSSTPEPASTPEPVESAVAAPSGQPETVREMLRRVDAAWPVFRASAARFPSERMDEHLTEDGWTRKQMLAHIAVWHDLTTERLGKLILSGKPVTLTDQPDAINARAARTAIGKTAGEVLGDIDGTFNRLRRQVQRLTDKQLVAHDYWAAQIIAGNTFEHYAEHMADVYMPEPEPTGRRR